jgi:hypothetical protein
MLVALTVRRLKPGALDDFLAAWKGGDEEPPPGWRPVYAVRNVEDENEVVAFGFFDGTLEDLRRSQQEQDYEGQRAKIDEYVESTGADGIYEVVESFE